MPAFSTEFSSQYDIFYGPLNSDKPIKFLPRFTTRTDKFFKVYAEIKLLNYKDTNIRITPRLKTPIEKYFKVIAGYNLEKFDQNFKTTTKQTNFVENLFKVKSKWNVSAVPAYVATDYSSEYDITSHYAIEYESLKENTFKMLPKFLLADENLFKVTTAWVYNISPSYAGVDYDDNYDVDAHIRTYDQLIKVYIGAIAEFNSKDQAFTVYSKWVLPFDQHYSVNVRIPTITDSYLQPGLVRDLLINLLTLLKGSWSLTDDILYATVYTGDDFSSQYQRRTQIAPAYIGLAKDSITFTTGWYDESIAMPQITITPISSVKTVLTTGDRPIYQYTDTASINIWVRPLQDTNQSIGWAKNAEYQIRQEVERILRSGSRIGSNYNNEEFIYISRRRLLDETNLRPVIFRSNIEVVSNQFKAEGEDV